jgi:hypothetical protein
MDPLIRSRLVRAAYLASLDEPVALMLRDVDAAEIDRILDPIVRGAGVNFAGVVYFEHAVTADGWREPTRLAIAETYESRAWLATNSVDYVDATTGLLLLENQTLNRTDGTRSDVAAARLMRAHQPTDDS